MLEPRLASHMQINLLVRRIGAEGGFATVLRKGDPVSGAILLICTEKGQNSRLLEKMPSLDGPSKFAQIWPSESGKQVDLDSYLEKRFSFDPDMWLVELDIPDAERLADEILVKA